MSSSPSLGRRKAVGSGAKQLITHSGPQQETNRGKHSPDKRMRSCSPHSPYLELDLALENHMLCVARAGLAEHWRWQCRHEKSVALSQATPKQY